MVGGKYDKDSTGRAYSGPLLFLGTSGWTPVRYCQVGREERCVPLYTDPGKPGNVILHACSLPACLIPKWHRHHEAACFQKIKRVFCCRTCVKIRLSLYPISNR